MRVPLRSRWWGRRLGPVRLLIGVLTVAVFGSTAHASPQEHLTAARAALQDGKRKDARIALDAAEAAFSQTDSVVLNDVLASYWFYRGVHADSRRQRSKAEDAFRQALVVDGTFAWDREVSEDLERRKLFEALRGEVEGRDARSARVPEKVGCAVPYVDGSRVSNDSMVSIGRRLAQIQCPRGDVHSVWFDFNDQEAPFVWLAMCPYEVDTSIEPQEGAESEDEFADLGPVFGVEAPGEPGPCAVEATAPHGDGSPAVAEKTEPSEGSSTDERAGLFNKSIEGWSLGRIAVTGGGVALLGASAVMHTEFVVPAYELVEAGRKTSSYIRQSYAQQLTEDYIRRRAMTRTVAGAGAAAFAVGMFVMQPGKTATVQPVLFPGGAGLNGRF